MVFSLHCLKFTADNQLHHLELFAGDCGVTRGEYSDMGRKKHVVCSKGWHSFPNHVHQNRKVEISSKGEIVVHLSFVFPTPGCHLYF